MYMLRTLYTTIPLSGTHSHRINDSIKSNNNDNRNKSAWANS